VKKVAIRAASLCVGMAFDAADLLAGAAAAGVTALNFMSGAIPQYDQRHVDIGALGLDHSASAKIVRDGCGVPTIFADSANDTFALHGVCVGQDRLWQIHQARLAAGGNLAQIKPELLTFCIFARQIGFARLGQEDWEALMGDEESADAVQMVEAFVRGVNWAASLRPAHGEMFTLTGKHTCMHTVHENQPTCM